MAGGDDSSKTTKTAPWRPQQPFLQDLYANAYNLYQQFQNPSAMPSQQVDPNANIKNAWQGTIDYANTGGKGVTDATQQNWGNLMGSMDVAKSPLVQSQITQANQQVADTFNRQIMPGISGDAFAAGQTGSSRQGVAEGLAAGEAAKSMGANATNIMANAYQIGSNNAQAAQAFAPTMYGMGNAANQTVGGVGQAQAGWEQAGLQDKYNQWMYGQTRPWDIASMYQGLITGNYGGTASGN